jgi:hypothetical protein
MFDDDGKFGQQYPMRPLPFILLALSAMLVLGQPVALAAAFDESPVGFSDIFQWRIGILGYGIYRDVETQSILNEGNRLQISRYQTGLDIRPDVELEKGRLELSIKPRARLTYEKWDDGGALDGESESDEEIYINEWLARLMVTEALFVSYGREKLLWGPSYLLSPSNPFAKSNGRNNPKLEVAGMDSGRLVWIPHSSWAASLIANTGEGRREFFKEFAAVYALKLDYTGYQKYFSLIPSYREKTADRPDEWRLGFFGNWSVSDALLFYGEGNLLFDTGDQTNGAVSVATSGRTNEQETGDTDVLVGISYTFHMGPTVSMEYYHNEGGCSGPVHECLPPWGSADLDDLLIRSDYGMLQLVDTHMMDTLDIILRWIWDMDDHSWRAVGILEYAIGDHLNLFAIGDYFSGGTDDEFGSIMQGSVFGGLELIY